MQETPQSFELGQTIELRTEPEGRTIVALAAPFSNIGVGPKGPEVYRPGAVDTTATVPLVDHHEIRDGKVWVGPARGTVEFVATPAGYEAHAVIDDTDDGRRFYDEIRAGLKRNVSLGFKTVAERMERGVRVLERIMVDHVAVLAPAASPAYTGATVTEVRTQGDTMETETVVEAPEAETPTVSDDTEVRALREDLAELGRKLDVMATTQVTVGDSPESPWSPLEVRTAGEWLFHAVRATQGLPNHTFSPEEQRISLEKLGGNVDEIRAVTSTPASGLGAAIPDQYLGPIEDLYRAGRPFINALGSMPLPSAGIDVHRPVVTQGSLVAWESTEGDEPSSQAVTISDVTGALKALKSAMKATLQTALRSNPSAVDAMLRDQAAAMGTELDNSAINGTGTITTATGELAGVLANGSIVTGTAIDTSYTSTKLLASLTAAFVSILTAAPASSMSDIFITMAPRRWGDTLALEDGNNRPIVNISSDPAQNTIGDGSPVAGTLMRVPVVVDDNIPENLGVGTDQDNIIVASRRSFELFEGTRLAASWQDPATMQTTYGSAVLAALLPIYPGALVTITGTGMT
jgi:HK97 family phage major capsid protein